jgi:hypothetical protein
MKAALTFVVLLLASPCWAQSPTGQVSDLLHQLMVMQGNQETRNQVLELELLESLQRREQPSIPMPSPFETVTRCFQIAGQVVCRSYER